MNATTPITIGYTPKYLAWTGSHASPQRARLAVEHILARTEDQHIETRVIEPELDRERAFEELSLVHSEDFIRRVFKGDEPGAPGKLQGTTATYMFLGTSVLVEQIEADGMKPQVYFNPQGAKHHAAYAHSSGFCVFNDMAWAAQYFAAKGLRVAYLDWDAHHGDGVEALTAKNSSILTASIHQRGIFPGTGMRTSAKNRAFNYPLEAGAGDDGLLEAVEDAIYAIRDFEPHIILLACGADGLKGDPLSSLGYSIEEGIIPASEMVGDLAHELGVPVLIGGSGGYQPFTYVPIAWAETVLTIHDALTRERGHKGTAMVLADDPEWERYGNAWDEDDALQDDRQDDRGARKQAIMDDLADRHPLTWEGLLTREEFDIVQEEITPIILAAMEAEVGAKPSTRGERNNRRRAAKGKQGAKR